MTDTTPAGATLAAAGATPAQTPPTDPAPPATGAPPTPPADDTLGDAGKRALDAERDARREAEKRAKAAEVELKKLQDAGLSDQERKDARLAELEREIATERLLRQEATLRAETYSTAQRLGFRAPEIAYRLLSPSEVVYAEDGTPKNVQALLQTVIKDHPYLASGTTDYGGGPRGTPPTAVSSMNAAIRKAAGRS